MRWFISDTFFGCEQAIERFERPFESAEDMDNILVKNWNQAVGEDDTVYHLGNFWLGKDESQIEKLLFKLNGIKLLFKGNYDQDVETLMDSGFHGVFESAYMKIGLCDCFLSHEPLPMNAPGTWSIHGQEMTNWKILRAERKICMSTDNWGFKPVSENELGQYMQRSTQVWN